MRISLAFVGNRKVVGEGYGGLIDRRPYPDFGARGARALFPENLVSPPVSSAFSAFFTASGLNLVASDISRTVTQPAVLARKL